MDYLTSISPSHSCLFPGQGGIRNRRKSVIVCNLHVSCQPCLQIGAVVVSACLCVSHFTGLCNWGVWSVCVGVGNVTEKSDVFFPCRHQEFCLPSHQCLPGPWSCTSLVRISCQCTQVLAVLLIVSGVWF